MESSTRKVRNGSASVNVGLKLLHYEAKLRYSRTALIFERAASLYLACQPGWRPTVRGWSSEVGLAGFS
jgi:hypothetical protein